MTLEEALRVEKTTPKGLKILFVGSEIMPYAATGGLGDVLGSLPAALAARYPGCDVRVVMPLYSSIGEEWRKKMKDEAAFYLRLAWRRQYCGIKSLSRGGVLYYFIDNEYYFKRDALYGHYDDGERFAFFCMATMELIRHLEFWPDIIHAHDWQGGLSIVYKNLLYRGSGEYDRIKTVYTIHNIEYQGQFDHAILGDVFALGNEYHELLDYHGRLNLMKAAICCADRVTTVSPRYAGEIRTPEYGRGLEYILNENPEKLCGILNGIDYDYYNPETDPALAVNYSWKKIEGKYKNKAMLQKELELPVREVPLLAIISRLASHKGLDLVCEIAGRLISEHDLQLVVLGRGETRFEEFFKNLEERHFAKVRTIIDYNRELSRRIYAAADIFLMPSKSEPCGLSQMIASRYGAIPVVRETGGLADSIKGFWEEDGELHGNGFTFVNYSTDELLGRIMAAVSLWQDEKKRFAFIKKVMQIDFSWDSSAGKYMEVYEGLFRSKGGDRK
ncbi:MAG: glycogen synthase GlgA [Clostridiales bacterium]|nr:glycogen synthase GlgA [Clostridiales bacterium]